MGSHGDAGVDVNNNSFLNDASSWRVVSATIETDTEVTLLVYKWMNFCVQFVEASVPESALDWSTSVDDDVIQPSVSPILMINGIYTAVNTVTTRHYAGVIFAVILCLSFFLLSVTNWYCTKFANSTSVFGDGRISTHADPTSTRRAISRTAHL